MKRVLLTGVAALTAASLSACNVQLTTPQNGTSAAPAAPAAPAQPAQPAQPAPGGGDAGGTPSADVQAGARQNFTVNNQTGHIVVVLNVSPSNDNNWGPDILGSQILQNGQSADVTFPRNTSQCLWDIRATYDDGATTVMSGVNLCEAATVNLIPG